MTGVEILSSEAIYNTILPKWCLAVGFLAVILFGALISASVAYEKGWACILCIVCFIGSAGLMIFSGIENKTNISHIEYKVTIDDSVSMNEFLDKYEILDQEGKIYTVKEKKQ